MAYPAPTAQVNQQAQFYAAAPAVQQYQYQLPAAPAPAPAVKSSQTVSSSSSSSSSIIPAVAEVKYRKVALAPEYPAGVDPAACPNYPYCGAPELQYARFRLEPVAAGFADESGSSVGLGSNEITAPRYPADFDATKCIDYPFCTQKA